MKLLGKVVDALRVWMGLADASGSQLTPSHGWLLPVLVDARRQRKESAAQLAARLQIERNARA